MKKEVMIGTPSTPALALGQLASQASPGASTSQLAHACPGHALRHGDDENNGNLIIISLNVYNIFSILRTIY